MSESTYTIDGTRVKGEGWSYNLTNKKDAEKLCQTLNTYHKTQQLNQNIEKQHDKIQKQIIQIQLTTRILNEEIKILKETIECLSK